MRQRPSPTRRSRKFDRYASERWARERMALVVAAFDEMRAIERASFDKMLRDWPPYPTDVLDGIPESRRVRVVREGSV